MAVVELKGLDKVLKNLNKEVRKIKGRTLAGTVDAALHVRIEAMIQAPVITGNLMNSAFVTFPGGRGVTYAHFRGKNAMAMKANHDSTLSASVGRCTTHGAKVEVGFSANYAAKVHENPRAGAAGYRPEHSQKKGPLKHSQGGKWKFLEDPLKDIGTILEIIRRRARID